MARRDRWRWSASLTALGLAMVQVLAMSASPVRAQSPEPAEARFDVRAIQVVGNHILPPEQVEEIVYPFMGPGRSPEDIEQARATLQKAYEDKGYATVSVVIPEQSVDGGIIRLEVQPQTIGTLTVAGGTRTSEAWVRDRAPSLTPGTTPNFTALQRDIVALNQSADRTITPEVKAGAAPGTVDVVLNVEDRSPWHATAEFNNFSSAATTEYRASGTVRYDDLWGRGDSLSLSVQTAPERTEDGTVVSANYLSRVGRGQLLGYFVHSDSDIAVIGGTSVVGKGDLAGVRLIWPLGQSEGFYHALTVGMDWKDFKEDVTLGADSDSAPIRYFPFTIGWRGDWGGEGIQSNASATAVFGVRGLGDGIAAFDYKRFGAKPDFFVLKGEAATTADLWGLQLYSRLTSQWSADPLISNEGFSLGGMDTVRGYFESEALGDYGFAAQFEVRSPELGADMPGAFMDELRVYGFMDSGAAWIHRPLIGQDDHWGLISAGAGLRLKMFRHLNGAIDVGVPLKAAPDTDDGALFTRFRIWGDF